MTNLEDSSVVGNQNAMEKGETKVTLGQVDIAGTTFKMDPSPTITIPTRQLAIIIAVTILVVIVLIVITALFGGPYMSKVAEIKATASKEAFLSQNSEKTKVPDEDILQSDSSYPSTYIEEQEMSVYEFQKNAGAYFFLDTYQKGNNYSNRYFLKYTIDSNTAPGWSGISFEFISLVDFSQYNRLTFKIQFTKNPSPLWLDVYSIKPGTHDNQRMRLIIGDGKYGSLVGIEQEVNIPIHELDETDVSQITNIIFTSDETLVTSPEEHEFSVSEIMFVKSPEK